MCVRRILLAVTLLIWLTPVVGRAQQPPRPAAQNLPETHARERSARVTDVRYEVAIRLSATAQDYTGDVVIHFELTDAGSDLTLDFDGGTVQSLAVNGTPVTADYNGHYLLLQAGALMPGGNEVRVGFSRPYSSDGSGLYRFIDPEDGRAYLYTDFEPYDQNRLFPAFDQPDLKARYTTTVRAPQDWQVIANTREAAIESDGPERVWRFPQTPPISTYVYALHAGEYRVWESTAGDIPLRLFARESLAAYVYPDHWFEPTRQGFDFFQSYFDTPYPFGKYDQVIVPHFNAGAMENVAAVTFSERYLRRGGVTRQNRRAIASVILHEMAHMWFGDLVTMDWWNGLWLNESFATVMAVLAMTEATEFDDEWQEAFRDTVRAYRADERDTTHPIELPVPDTDSAFANFDRITYQKGSATLVQLMHLVGPAQFRRGVIDYLSRHAYGNTTIDDFLDAISRSADKQLESWADDWLLTPGTNAVEIETSCVDGKITGMTVLQTAPAQWPTLRTHRTQLGLYRFTTDGAIVETLPVTYAGENTDVPDARQRPCPDFVYANHGDWDYVRVRLSAGTLTMLDGNLSRIDDPLARLMLWQSVWDSVLDARMPLAAYVEFALNNHPDETNEAAIRQVLAALSSAAGYAEEIVTDPAAREALQHDIEDYVWTRTVDAAPGSDMQLLFYDAYVGLARSPAAVDRIADLLTGARLPPDGLSLDPDRRWNAISTVTRAGHVDSARLRAAQTTVDKSADGRLRALSTAVARPAQAVKENALEQLLDPESFTTLAEFRAVAGGLFPRGQHQLQLRNAPAAIAGLRTLSMTRDAGYFSAYANGLLGPVCDRTYRDMLAAAIDNGGDLHPLLRRSLLDSRFETDRCLRMRSIQTAAF